MLDPDVMLNESVDHFAERMRPSSNGGSLAITIFGVGSPFVALRLFLSEIRFPTKKLESGMKLDEMQNPTVLQMARNNLRPSDRDQEANSRAP